MLQARVVRVDASHGALHMAREVREFDYLPDGVRFMSGLAPIYILKFPLALGTSWYGERGGRVKIVAIDVAVSPFVAWLGRAAWSLHDW